MMKFISRGECNLDLVQCKEESHSSVGAKWNVIYSYRIRFQDGLCMGIEFSKH